MDRRLTAAGLALALALAPAACGDDGSGPEGLRIRVQGTVTESVNGLPLEAAAITVQRLDAPFDSEPVATTQTNAQGRYSLDFRAEGPCEGEGPIPSPFTFGVSRPGYIAPIVLGFPECADTLQVRDVEMLPLP